MSVTGPSPRGQSRPALFSPLDPQRRGSQKSALRRDDLRRARLRYPLRWTPGRRRPARHEIVGRALTGSSALSSGGMEITFSG